MTEQERKRNRAKAAKLRAPKPQELPSGQWRCQVMVGGKRVSFTDDDPVAAYEQAVSARAGYLKKSVPAQDLTVGDAIDRYIDAKEMTLSPTTIRSYRQIRRTVWGDIADVKVNALTNATIQRRINVFLSGDKKHTVKSARNALGLLTASISMCAPDVRLKVDLPQRAKPDIKIPSNADMEKILAEVRGLQEELPIMLGAMLGLRMSEICGLTWDCIEGGRLHVKQALVKGEGGPVLKGTKTYSSDRWLSIPAPVQAVLARQERTGEYVTTLNARQIYGRFSAACKRAGVPHYRFHDLRHYNASVMLSMGVPDKYAMERMGHATNNMLKTVYQHTMAQKQKEIDAQMDAFFQTTLHTNCTR